jgi:hypothetical protein
MGSRLEDSFRERITKELFLGWDSVPRDRKEEALGTFLSLRDAFLNYKVAAHESFYEMAKGLIGYFVNGAGLTALEEAVNYYGAGFIADSRGLRLPASNASPDKGCYGTIYVDTEHTLLGVFMAPVEGFLSDDGVPLDYGEYHLPNSHDRVVDLSLAELAKKACGTAYERHMRREESLLKVTTRVPIEDITEAYNDRLATHIVNRLQGFEDIRMERAYEAASALAPYLFRLYAISGMNIDWIMNSIIEYFKPIADANHLPELLEWIIKKAKWYPALNEGVLVIPLNMADYLATAVINLRVLGIWFRVVPLDTVLTMGYLPRDSASCYRGTSTDTCYSNDPEEILGNLLDLAEKRVEASEKEEKKKEELLKEAEKK